LIAKLTFWSETFQKKQIKKLLADFLLNMEASNLANSKFMQMVKVEVLVMFNLRRLTVHKMLSQDSMERKLKERKLK